MEGFRIRRKPRIRFPEFLKIPACNRSKYGKSRNNILFLENGCEWGWFNFHQIAFKLAVEISDLFDFQTSEGNSFESKQNK